MKHQELKKYSLKRRILSFVYAFHGIKYFLISQPNALIHTFAASIAIILSVWLPLNKIEWCLIILSISFVFVAELFNTAIEVFIDYISPSYNISAGRSKDLAAGAVLFAAIAAAVIGGIIFIPKIIILF